MQLYTVSLYFLQTALHVSDDTLIHHQEHIQTLITSGTARTVFATVSWRGGVGTHFLTPPHQQTVANTVRAVPDVITVKCAPDDGWVYHLKHVELSAENIMKLYIVASCWTLLTMIHYARTHEHKKSRMDSSEILFSVTWISYSRLILVRATLHIIQATVILVTSLSINYVTWNNFYFV